MMTDDKVKEVRKADFSGAFAQVWRQTFEHPTCVAQWIILAPHSHPLWPWLSLSLIHLRDIGDGHPPHIALEGATHEIILAALNPDSYPPDVDDPKCNILTPLNFSAQFISESDDAAIKHVETMAIVSVCSGFLNPDTDGFSGWVRVWGDSMVRK